MLFADWYADDYQHWFYQWSDAMHSFISVNGDTPHTYFLLDANVSLTVVACPEIKIIVDAIFERDFRISVCIFFPRPTSATTISPELY